MSGTLSPALKFCAPQTIWRSPCAVVDAADGELVGVRMLVARDDLRDDDAVELAGDFLHALDFEAEHGEPLGQFLGRPVEINVLFEPVKGDFHRKFCGGQDRKEQSRLPQDLGNRRKGTGGGLQEQAEGPGQFFHKRPFELRFGRSGFPVGLRFPAHATFISPPAWACISRGGTRPKTGSRPETAARRPRGSLITSVAAFNRVRDVSPQQFLEVVFHNARAVIEQHLARERLKDRMTSGWCARIA